MSHLCSPFAKSWQIVATFKRLQCKCCPIFHNQRIMKSSIFNIFWSFTSLLPGDLNDCPDPANATDTTCVGGSAAVASVIRHSIESGDGPAFHFPKLDRESKFVAMHPEGWGINRLILHDYFGWNSFEARPSLFTDEKRLGSTNLLTPNFRPTISNLALLPSSK